MFGAQNFLQVARNTISFVYCSYSIMLHDWKLNSGNIPTRNQMCIVTVCCHVYLKSNRITTLVFCKSDDMWRNADAGIRITCLLRFFCVVRRLVFGSKPLRLLWISNVKIWGLLYHCRQFWSHYCQFLCPLSLHLGVYNTFYRNLNLVYISN